MILSCCRSPDTRFFHENAMKRKLFRSSIPAKLMVILTGVNCVIYASIVIFAGNYTYTRFGEEVEDKGVSIARNLASNIVEPVLLEDFVKLQKMVSSALELEEDARYIYYIDREKSSYIHTFPGNFPGGLAEANPVGGGSHSVELLSTEIGPIRDIGYPVLDGLLGSVHIGMSEERILLSVSSLVRSVTYMLVFLSILGLSFIYFLSRRTLTPLDRLLSAIENVGKGDFNQRIELETHGELGLLARTFNEMTRRLENANLELEKAQGKLLQAAKMTTAGQFSAGIAHEINNPLSGVLNCIRTLLANPEIRGQYRGYLELSLKGLIRIENIIRQILGAGGEIQLDLKPLDINLMLDESISLARPKLSGKDIELEKIFAEKPPLIPGDACLLQQVFLNIIHNAVDAMGPGGLLRAETRFVRRRGEMEIKFTDNGQGIKAGEIDKIFDPFFTTKEVGKGVGLGLYLSYNYLQRHGGSINIESSEGRGTTVTIILPSKNALGYTGV